MSKTNILLIFIIWSYACLAQDHIYKNFTTNDGLSSSEVYDITQDKNGFLWFATDRGLTRYDGYNFKKYTVRDGLTDIVVFNFYEQPDGKIWCSTFNKKLFYYDPDKDQFIAYKYNHLLENIPIGFTINNIYVGDHGSFFITFKRLLGYLEIDNLGEVNNQTSRVYVPPTIKASINPKCYSFTFDSEKVTESNTSDYIIKKPSFNLSFGYFDTFYSTDRNLLTIISQREIYIINTKDASEKHIISKKNILISGKYDDDHFWVGLQHGGVKIYDYYGNLTDHFLKDKSVTKILKDHEGGLWISTIDSGVFYAKYPQVLIHDLHIKGENKHAYRLTKNNKNELYVSYHNGEVYKRSKNQFQLIWKSPDNYKSEVQYYSKDNRLIIQSAHNNWEEGKGLTNNIGHGGMLSDNRDAIPVTGKSIFSQLLPGKRIKTRTRVSKRVHDIEYSAEGYYLATFSGLYEYRNDSVYDVRKTNSLLSYRMDDIDKYKERYYIASLGAGLIVKDKDTVYAINQSNGLNSDLTTQVHIENEHEIYLATNSGFSKITYSDDHQNYIVSRFSTSNGLPSNEVNDIEVIGDTLWVATKNGLCSLPKSIIEPVYNSVKNDWLRIKTVKINDKIIDDHQVLRYLKYFQNSVTIGFSAISFKNKNQTLYRYRLLEIEPEWNLTKNREIRYPDLKPGQYTFEVQTKGANKNWNLKSTYLEITITPPLWNTWWFYVLLTISILLIIYSFFKFRILLYNKDIIRELLRFVLKKIKGEKHYITIKESNTEIKLNTSQINYIKSSGNYLEIYTTKKMYLIRGKISDFQEQLPDMLEYIRIHRSYLIRIEKVQQKNHKTLQINGETIPVGKTYKQNLDKIIF
ncbi:ligand-binding sensor domain-containing protein [Aquimarina sp. 2201CG5-10]|uniref:ligand-binding sensor domain-containing protein n=1 Tax=Aquimarina callyspongiae TaxID=3098150 RepID=UPI002AB34843|nr:LytTR family transcriptional regulator DNA-binding domain-containing protein [Aquimarina sp. 2201CG5-10]MDY8136990.1 LytTR family transcriptional regulator DNA-binding domain-containing protein [Aquimarina sp. 2201CG5-10]